MLAVAFLVYLFLLHLFLVLDRLRAVDDVRVVLNHEVDGGLVAVREVCHLVRDNSKFRMLGVEHRPGWTVSIKSP